MIHSVYVYVYVSLVSFVLRLFLFVFFFRDCAVGSCGNPWNHCRLFISFHVRSIEILAASIPSQCYYIVTINGCRT